MPALQAATCSLCFGLTPEEFTMELTEFCIEKHFNLETISNGN